MIQTNEHPTHTLSASTRRLPCSGRVVACVESREFLGRAEQLGAWPLLPPRDAADAAGCALPLAADPSARCLGPGAVAPLHPRTVRAADTCWALGGRLRHGTGHLGTGHRQHGSDRTRAAQRSGGPGVHGGALAVPHSGGTAGLAGRAAALAAKPGRGRRAAAFSAASGPLRRSVTAPGAGGILHPPYIQTARLVRSYRTIRNHYETRHSDQRRPAGGVPDCHP